MFKNTRYLIAVFVVFIGASISANKVFAQDKFVVMIDPGHGGRDSGTPGTKRYKTAEKDIALDVSLALGKMITTQLPYIDVMYTRTKDVFPALDDRSKLANDNSVDLFISIHCNAQPKGGSAYGTETFVLGLHKNAANLEVAKRENSVIYLEENYEENYKDFNPDSPESLIGLIISQEEYLEQSIELADYIETEFKTTAKRKSRGVKQAGLYVLAYTYMPSVLVELGFLTNNKEEDFLNSKKGKAIMTKSLFKAFKKYVQSRISNTIVLENETKDTLTPVEEAPIQDEIYSDITFKVQLAAGKRKLKTKPYNFKGLKEISREKSGKVYRYFYGNTSNYKLIKRMAETAKQKGYPKCFVVAYKNGKRINLKDALKTSIN